MKKQYQHFIITRFNIPVRYAGGKNPSVMTIDPRIDMGYLDKRFQLFTDYTLPSMIAQTNQDFVWLVLFSDKTPDKYKMIINKIKEQCSTFLPCYLTDNESYDFNKYLSDKLNLYDADYFITTRIDNDDAISTRFVEKLQNYCNKTNINKAALSFGAGIQFTIKSNTIAKQKYLCNHFISLIVPKEKENRTIISYQHGLIGEEYEIIDIGDGLPMWLEVIHETNYANKNFLNIRNVVISTGILEEFACDIDWTKKDIFKNVIWSFFTTFHLLIKVLKSKFSKVEGKFVKQ